MRLNHIKRKTFAFPEGKLNPPDLSALIDRVLWAAENPECWTKMYLNLLSKDISYARECLNKINGVVNNLRKQKEFN